MRTPVSEYAKLLIRYLRPQAARVLCLGVLLLANIALQLANPQLLRRFLDAAQGGEPVEGLLPLALFFVGLAVAQQLVSVLATYTGEVVAGRATSALRGDLSEHCLRLDMGFQSAHSPGEMIERIDGDVSTLANFFSQFVLQVLGGALMLSGALVLLWREGWRAGLAITIAASGALGIMVLLRSLGVLRHAAERQASAELLGFLEERLGGTEDIRGNGTQPHVMRLFFGLMRRQMVLSLKAALVSNVLFTGTMLVFTLCTAGALATGAYLFHRGLASLGTVYLIYRYMTLLQDPIDRLTFQLQDFQRAGAGVARVSELLRTPSRVSDAGAADGSVLPAGALEVTFEGVSFAYTGEEATQDKLANVLHDVSFSLPAGAVLGLLGRTGSGKSTLARLLVRFYDPTSGAIRLGPRGTSDIRGFALADLRSRVGMVTQNIQLFRATVRDNLTFFDPAIPDEHIRRAVEELGLEEWLAALPDGLESVLEAGGAGLSAGQAQLLAFTRVFLRDPGLLILDEASSRLDAATERTIERAVDRLLGGGRRTAIVIAHRLATVGRADRIMVLSEGRILEEGKRADLAADGRSHFHRLLRRGLEEVLA